MTKSELEAAVQTLLEQNQELEAKLDEGNSKAIAPKIPEISQVKFEKTQESGTYRLHIVIQNVTMQAVDHTKSGKDDYLVRTTGRNPGGKVTPFATVDGKLPDGRVAGLNLQLLAYNPR